MIVGVVLVVGLLVTRLSQDPPALPEIIVLPDGTRAQAFTQGPDWYAVVTADNHILIYDRLTGALAQKVKIDLGE